MAPRSQFEIIGALRTKLHGCYPDDGDFLSTVRSLRWQSGADTQTNIRHDGHTLGNKVEARVTGANDLPESITFVVPVFDVPGAPCAAVVIPCQVMTHVEKQQIWIAPQGSALLDAIADTLESIEGHVRTALDSVKLEAVPILRGAYGTIKTP